MKILNTEWINSWSHIICKIPFDDVINDNYWRQRIGVHLLNVQFRLADSDANLDSATSEIQIILNFQNRLQKTLSLKMISQLHQGFFLLEKYLVASSD